MGTYKAERKLSKAVDGLIGEMNGTLLPEVAGEAEIDRNLADAKLRDEAIAHLRWLLTCRKLSERSLLVDKQEVTYESSVLISANQLKAKDVVKDSFKVA